VTATESPPLTQGGEVPTPVDPLFESFDRICRQLAGFTEWADPSWVDGYLTALAAGARHVEMDEWLPAMFGDAFERAFADPGDVAQARDALAAWYARLCRELDPAALVDDPDRLHIAPLVDEWTDADREAACQEGLSREDAALLLTGSLWCTGFFAAVDTFAADWPEPDDSDTDEAATALRDLMQTIECLALPESDERFASFAARQWQGGIPTREELLDEVCFAVQDLRLYWLDHAPKPPPRRVEHTPGRNDPCPCGSGRKYKKCHGARA
jgi:uncharacterized protein